MSTRTGTKRNDRPPVRGLIVAAACLVVATLILALIDVRLCWLVYAAGMLRLGWTAGQGWAREYDDWEARRDAAALAREEAKRQQPFEPSVGHGLDAAMPDAHAAIMEHNEARWV